MTSSVVFIDSRVADPDSLIASLAPGTVCYQLDATSDGLAQIASALSGHAGLDSIHIVSHGAPGSLLLGASTLDAAGLAARAATLADIGASLGPDGDLLLYGCSVAEGADGRAFVDLFAQLTGADVAASTDPTGAAARDGDWELEARTSVIETTAWQPLDYRYLLATPTGSVSIDDTTPAQNQTLTASNTLGDTDGLGAITYQWWASLDGATNWIYAGSGANLTPGQSLVNYQLKVVARYIDGLGYLEQPESTPPTAAVTDVNDAPSGSVTISVVGSSSTVEQNKTLSASNNLSDADGLGEIDYQWQYSYDNIHFFDITGSTQSTLTLDQARVGQYVRVVASYTDGGGFSNTSASTPSLGPVADVNDAPSGSVSISGTVAAENTLTATLNGSTPSTSFSDADGLGAISYQWKISDGGTSGWTNLSTGSTLVLSAAQVGKYIQVVASYTDGQNHSESVTSTSSGPVTNFNHLPTGNIYIKSNPSEDDVLTITNASGTTTAITGLITDSDGINTGTITYQWQMRADSSSAWSGTGVTTPTLTLSSQSYVGKEIRVLVGYTDNNGTTESVASNVSAAVLNVNDPHTGTVSLSDDTPMQGQTITATNNFADIDGLNTVSYKWERDDDTTALGESWQVIGNSNTLTLTSNEVNKTVRVTASYTDLKGTLESAVVSTASVVTPPNTSPTGSVSIKSDTSEIKQGSILTASNTLADADGLGTISYLWQSSSDLSTWTTAGTGKSLSLPESLVGKYIRVLANYTDGFGTSESVSQTTSAPVANVNDAYSGSVTISGTATLNQKLTAANSLADPDNPLAAAGSLTVTYTWEGSSDGSTWAEISTGASLGLSEAQIGKYIRVKASYTDGHNTPEFAYSSPTSSKVTNINTSPTGEVKITGTAQQGQVLTASNTLIDGDGTKTSTFTYQWQASSDNGNTWSNLSTGNTLTLSQANVGKTIRVLAGYIDDLFTSESIPSTATAAVQNANDSPSGTVRISGSAVIGRTLTASHTLSDSDGLGPITYQWQYSTDGTTWNNLSTGESLGLSETQVGNAIRVIARYTDGYGNPTSVESTPTKKVQATSAGSGGSDSGSGDYGSGNDKITGESGDNVIDAGGGNNMVTTGAGNDQITSGSGNDKIKAGDGDNVINAGNGKNSIVTGSGSDQIVTGSGSDQIEAGAGSDTVNPGSGKDKVTLGLGADALILDNRASGGADTVNYFNATEDQFQFDINVFTALAGGVGTDNLVIGTRPVARDADDFLLFDTQKGRLYYDADGDGSGRAILIVAVKFAIGTPDSDNFTVF